MTTRRRPVHPAAWWCWAVLVGAAALRVTNPLVNGVLIAAVWVVVAARRRDTPWSRSFGGFVRLGLLVLGVRLVLQLVFAPSMPGHVVVTLPSFELPAWAAGVRIGGPVTLEALVAASLESLRLVTLLAAVGAANSLADPHRLLRTLPSALYEAGVAVTVALTVAPQAGSAAAEVRDARRLRGRPTRGWAAMRGVALPVLEGALDRSLALAAAMDARGFGRRDHRRPGRERWAAAASLAGPLALAVGLYGLLDTSAPRLLGAPTALLGVALCLTGLAFGGTQTRRTRYRPDPWQAPEWATVSAGALCLALIVVAGRSGDGLSMAISPLAAPSVPVLAALAALAALAPAVLTPEPDA